MTAADGISATVTLDGSASFDTDGTIEFYMWEPEDNSYSLFGVNPSVSLDVGIHIITLIVTDDDGASDTDEVIITVEAPSLTCHGTSRFLTRPASQYSCDPGAVGTARSANAMLPSAP